MIFLGLTTVLSNVFYAFGDTKTTLHISLVDIVLNIILDYFMYKTIGVAGLALATSISAMLCTAIRFVVLKRYVSIDYLFILKELLKIIIASLSSVLFARYMINLFGMENHYFLIITSLAIVLFFYFVISKILKCHTLDLSSSFLKNKLKKQ